MLWKKKISIEAPCIMIPCRRDSTINNKWGKSRTDCYLFFFHPAHTFLIQNVHQNISSCTEYFNSNEAYDILFAALNFHHLLIVKWYAYEGCITPICPRRYWSAPTQASFARQSIVVWLLEQFNMINCLEYHCVTFHGCFWKIPPVARLSIDECSSFCLI